MDSILWEEDWQGEEISVIASSNVIIGTKQSREQRAVLGIASSFGDSFLAMTEVKKQGEMPCFFTFTSHLEFQ